MVFGFVLTCALMCFRSLVPRVISFPLSDDIGRTYMKLDVLSCRKFGMAHCFLIGKKKKVDFLIWNFLLVMVLEMQEIF